jgi:hypothetical protein
LEREYVRLTSRDERLTSRDESLTSRDERLTSSKKWNLEKLKTGYWLKRIEEHQEDHQEDHL